MNDPRYRWKFIAIFILSGCILVGILFLSFSGILNTPAPTPTPTITIEATPEVVQTPVPTPEPTPTPMDITSDWSVTKLVNSYNKIDSEYVPEGLVTPEVAMNPAFPQQIKEDALQPLYDMFAAAQESGISLKLVSGYRSYAEQLSLWYTYSQEKGTATANRIDCHPGASEHQLGLAVDLGQASGGCELRSCFSQTTASAWLADNAWQYGFILRYPDGKESVTGIMYSPWHYRYVGLDLAKAIHDSGLTMDEYLQQ